MSSIISFKDFGFQYTAQSSPTLSKISFSVAPGEKILIAGASGSGKSTIGSCINGLIPHSYDGVMTGSLQIDGQDYKKHNIFSLSQTVGTVLQDTDGQFIGLTVAEDIAFALENIETSQEDMIRIVDEVANLVDINSHLSYAPHELSGGQKQRVSLAGVMVDDVKVLLFDEPLANLDPAAGKATIELIDRIQKHTGAAVIIIEHRLEDVLWRSMDRVILMKDGTIVADMKPEELLCTDLLEQHGIREPLYLTGLRYAGVEITPDIHPEHIDALTLSSTQISKVKDWYDKNRQDSPKDDGASTPLLSVEHLSFGYQPDHLSLEDVNFSIQKGEMLSIVGRNGAGKSTLAKLICGFEQPTSGTIRFHGMDLAGETIKERANHIGYVMQNPNQMISKPMIWDEVELALLQTSMTAEERKARVEEALKTCGLYPFRNWPISALSYGQKKRVTIASILVQRPEIIILDEPTAGQDYHHYTEIMEFLKSLNDQGYTILLITHDMHLMLEYTKRAIVFSRGHLLADETAAHVLNNPSLVEQASLKETSLYHLCLKCGIENPQEFTECFIRHERRNAHGRSNHS